MASLEMDESRLRTIIREELQMVLVPILTQSQQIPEPKRIHFDTKQIAIDYTEGMSLTTLAQKHRGNETQMRYQIKKAGLFVPVKNRNTLTPVNDTSKMDLSLSEFPDIKEDHFKKTVDTYQELKDVKATAKALNISEKQVYFRLKKNNHPLFKTKKGRKPKAITTEVIGYLEQNHTVADTALHFKITEKSVYYHKKINKNQNPTETKKEEQNQLIDNSPAVQTPPNENTIEIETKKETLHTENTITPTKRSTPILHQTKFNIDENSQKIIDYYNSTHNLKDTAKHFGFYQPTVKKILESHNISYEDKKTNSVKNPSVSNASENPAVLASKTKSKLVTNNEINVEENQENIAESSKKESLPEEKIDIPVSSSPVKTSNKMANEMRFFEKIHDTEESVPNNNTIRDPYSNIKKYPGINLDAIKAKIDNNTLPPAPVVKEFDEHRCVKKECPGCEYYIMNENNKKECKRTQLIKDQRSFK